MVINNIIKQICTGGDETTTNEKNCFKQKMQLVDSDSDVVVRADAHSLTNPFKFFVPCTARIILYTSENHDGHFMKVGDNK